MNEEPLFEQPRRLSDADRAEFLARGWPESAQRARVEALLAAHRDAGRRRLEPVDAAEPPPDLQLAPLDKACESSQAGRTLQAIAS